MAHHVGTDFAPFRFFYAENSVTRAVVPPFPQKVTFASPSRLQAPSLTPLAHYQPFASSACGVNISRFGIATSERTLLRSDFSMQKNQSHAPSFLLFRKKARSARLFACKRAHNGSQSIPPYCEMRLRRSLLSKCLFS